MTFSVFKKLLTQRYQNLAKSYNNNKHRLLFYICSLIIIKLKYGY